MPSRRFTLPSRWVLCTALGVTGCGSGNGAPPSDTGTGRTETTEDPSPPTSEASGPEDAATSSTATPPDTGSGALAGDGSTSVDESSSSSLDGTTGVLDTTTIDGGIAATGIDGSGERGESTTGATEALDVFGITELYPSASSGALWTSQHWSAHGPYALDARLDVHDPLQISGMRGTGTLEVTADGELVMGGSQPRIYVYPAAQGPWENVEVTVYYRRIADDATAYAGLVVGTRSGAEGHGDDPCDAHTYYTRLRHDGAMDFAKELMHPAAAVGSSVDASEVWPETGALPHDTWIGWKVVIYDLPEGGVKLEAYRDLDEGRAGGTWELVHETIDAGGWFAETTCDVHQPVDGMSDQASTEGGTTFIRNTGITEARYRWFSVREIAPGTSR